MTLVEFMYKFNSKSVRDKCLAVLYYEKTNNNNESLTVATIKEKLKEARVPKVAKMNLADTMGKAIPFVSCVGKEGAYNLWSLTDAGVSHVRSIIGDEPEVVEDVGSLEKILKGIAEKDVASYVEESIQCLKAGARRAAVVFLWVAAVRAIHQEIMKYRKRDIISAVTKHDTKARTVKNIDDLSCIKESVVLLAAQDLGIFDKNQKDILVEALNLRNKCGHPGKYNPGLKKVSSYIEDVVGIVFTP